jgi:valyl-tRNA synthetase
MQEKEELEQVAGTKIPEDLLSAYNAALFETDIYKTWEESGYFNPDNCIAGGITTTESEHFSIVMPPPNANGRLHAGHALFVTIQDVLTRANRMQGKRTLWIPGSDHAGFETQTVYEKILEKEGRSRFGMDRDDLYKEIYDFTMESKGVMESDIRRLGASCDWSRNSFTLDPIVVSKVQDTFRKMYNDGLVYRGKRSINWCSKHQTGLSDLETENKEEVSKLYYFKYGPFEIATARPETKFGDKYVVMHPDDTRYSEYTHGDKLFVEWINGQIEATIIKDDSIDMEFGTGVMTITPWHSQIDFDIAKRHNLEYEQIIDLQGKLLPIAGEFAGLKITVAREQIVAKLQTKNLVAKIDEKYLHNTKVCYKCNTKIEPQVNDQWFVKMAPLAEMALHAVRDEKKIQFYPDNYQKIFTYWMENTMDWNISRQIVWGIQIPAQICTVCNLGYIDKNVDMDVCTCRGVLRTDTDTFDTWFSSGQWTLLTCGYPDGTDLANYHPTSVMESGTDLIFKWIPRMVIFSLYLRGEVPFTTVYLHGLVNDSKGQKMSKSKGNVVNPITLIDSFGCDALRMGLLAGSPAGSDTNLSESKIKAYKNFANKIWNASRFVLERTSDYVSIEAALTQDDQAALAAWREVKTDITSDIENYRLHLASEKIYNYFWHTFCDELIESRKTRILESSDKHSAQKLLLQLLEEQLIVLHPFMPFITEKLWHLLGKETLLIIEPWNK